MNINGLLAMPKHQRERKLLDSQFGFGRLENILDIVPEKGIILFKMSLIDYESTMKKYLLPLFENISLTGSSEDKGIMMDYLYHRKEASEGKLKIDIANFKGKKGDVASLLAGVYSPENLPDSIKSVI